MSDGETRELVVTGFTTGTTQITPRDRQTPKTVHVVRVLVDNQTKPLFPPYYDLTAVTLTAQIEPILAGVTSWPKVLRITAYGHAPTRRYGVELVSVA
jgi:hypothetical protein